MTLSDRRVLPVRPTAPAYEPCVDSAFFNIQRELHSPYGQRRIDLAHESQAAALRRLAANLMDHADSRLPPRLLAKAKSRESSHPASPKPRGGLGTRKSLAEKSSGKEGQGDDDGAYQGGDAAGAELMGAF